MAEGVIPATLLAFNEDLTIDEAASRKHLRHCAEVEGILAITVNGHASEVHACTFAKQERILDISLGEVGDKLPLVCGIFADGSQEAARIASMAQRRGASALLVFPSQCFDMGAQRHPESLTRNYLRIFRHWRVFLSGV